VARAALGILLASIIFSILIRHAIRMPVYIEGVLAYKSQHSGKGTAGEILTTELLFDRPRNVLVWWMAPFFSGGGYCSEAISFALALYEQTKTGGLALRIAQHGDGFSWEFANGLRSEIRDLLGALTTAPYKGPLPGLTLENRVIVVVCHSEPGAWRPAKYSTSACPPTELDAFRGKSSSTDPTVPLVVTIGRTMFETDRLPEGWKDRLNGMDEVWVPTAFHKRVFIEGGVDPERIRTIGEPVDVHLFDAEAVRPLPLPGAKESTFKFLSVFKWEARKGWDVLLTSYFTEFSSQDDVALYMLTAPYHHEGASFKRR